MAKKSFIQGAAILGLSGIIVQILGAFFRIPLTNIIGDTGMGYYQTAYPIYIFLLVFSTNGAPAAISKMVSERLAIGQAREAHKVFKLAFLIMGGFGLVAAAVFFFGARPIVEALSNPGAYMCMLAIAPALLLVPVMAVFRGYFQGRQEMVPTAVSQFTEQVVRVAVGLSAAAFLMSMGLEHAAAGACLGTSIGPVFGILILIVIYFKRRKVIAAECDAETEDRANAADAPASDSKSILKTLAWISIPVTLGVSILPIMNVGDVLLVMRRLQDIGYTVEESSALYGQLSGMAGAIINIPQALALSVALSLVPSIAASASLHDKAELDKNVGLGLRTAVIIGMPCSIGLAVLAKPIMLLLFPTQEASIESSAGCLFVLALGVVFLAAALSMAGILQGLNHPGAAVKTLVGAFIVKLAATYILTGVESLNVIGAAVASTLAYIVIGILNVLAVKRYTGFRFNMKLTVVVPLVSGLVMGLAVAAAYALLSRVMGNTMSCILSIALGAVVYIALFIKLKGVTEEELKEMPMGGKLLKLLKKVHLM